MIRWQIFQGGETCWGKSLYLLKRYLGRHSPLSAIRGCVGTGESSMTLERRKWGLIGMVQLWDFPNPRLLIVCDYRSLFVSGHFSSFFGDLQAEVP